MTRSGSEIASWFSLMTRGGSVSEADGSPLRARYNLAPSQRVLCVVARTDAGAIEGDRETDAGQRANPASAGGREEQGAKDSGARRVSWMNWGLVPPWSEKGSAKAGFFNARAETAATKPAFRTAWKRRRCVVVADGFYEWTPRRHGHRAFHLRPTQGSLLALAGLYEERFESCTVLTTRASSDLEGIHHRMPVILASALLDAWLDPATTPAVLSEMTVPAPAGSLERVAVGRFVNDARRDDPRCLLPIDDRDLPRLSEPEAKQGELFTGEAGRCE